MKTNISAIVRGLIAAPLEAAGFEIWDVRFEKEGRDFNLIIELDRDGGIDLDACGVANNIIDPIIEQADPIENSYYIEVSSAGIERDLKKTPHFLHAAKRKLPVAVKLFAAENGFKEFNGIIINADNETADIETNNQTVKIKRKNIAKITAIYNKNGGI